METTRLVSTELAVSRIGLGCEPLGGTDWGSVDPVAAVAAISEALNLGVNLFDTADIYGLGRSEELLSEALGSTRKDAVVISKFGIRREIKPGNDRAKTYKDSSARWAFEAIEQSLRRLRLECIPFYLVHWPDPNTPIAETMGALDHCRSQGKIRNIGVSNFTAEQLREASRWARITIVEAQYNLLDRRPEADIFPLCKNLGISVIAYGPLSQGFLTGKYDFGHHFGSNDRRHRLDQFQKDFAANRRVLERLKEVSVRVGKSMAQVALRWVLDHPDVSSAIVGAKTPGQTLENIGALGWQLNSKDRSFLGESE